MTQVLKSTTNRAKIRGPVFRDFVRLKLQAELIRTGESVADAHTLAYSVTDGVIDGAAASAGIPPNAFNGGILAAIVAFFESAEGQALLAALVQMLIAMLGG